MKSQLLFLVVALFLATPVLAEGDFSTPEATLATYLQACREGDFEKSDLCYTHSSRQYLQEHEEFTQNRNPEDLRQAYDRLSQVEFTLEQVNEKRAILHPDDPKIPPFFLRQQKPGEGWRIDFHFMSNYLRADENGWSWRFPKAEGLWKSRK